MGARAAPHDSVVSPEASVAHAKLIVLPANLVIDHRASDAGLWVERAFGVPSPSALAGTVVGQPVQGNPSYRAWPWPGYTVIAYSPSIATLNVTIEPTGTVDLRVATETTWRALITAAEKTPALRSATLDDGTSGHELAHATTGFTAHVQRPENLLALATALVTVVWLAVALAIFEEPAAAILGAIPVFAAATVVAALAALYARQRKLVWM